MFSLSGKTALVTGASGGIGSVIAKSLHQQGATVILASSRADNPIIAELKAAMKERVFSLAADLSSPDAAQKLIEDAEKLAGSPDILVNNAGVTRDTLALRMTDEAWQHVLEVNLSAPFRLSRAALRGMMKKRTGRIISVGSVVGSTGNPGQANYSAAKAGLIAMSKSLAQEVASRNITVNVISPGFIATPMTDALNSEQKERILSRIPLSRMGLAEEIAAAVVYLASDEASYITGETLHINGGLFMG